MLPHSWGFGTSTRRRARARHGVLDDSRKDLVRTLRRNETKLEAAGQMKCCSACRTAKPISKFQVWRAAKDGRRRDCKACVEAGDANGPQLASLPPTLEHEGATR